jgi:hypothetical protein
VQITFFMCYFAPPIKRMKKYSLSLLLLLSFYTTQALSQGAGGKKKNASPEKPLQQVISETDKSVLGIKVNLESLKKTTIKKSADQDGGSSREIFRGATGIQLIALNTSKLNGEQLRSEYYYTGGQLIYAEHLRASADHKIYIEKFYFASGHLVAWINAKEQAEDKRSAPFKAMDDSLNIYAEKLKQESAN